MVLILDFSVAWNQGWVQWGTPIQWLGIKAMYMGYAYTIHYNIIYTVRVL